MLSPKKVKYRKVMKGNLKGAAYRGGSIQFGEYALKAVECGKLTSQMIEAGRIAVNRKIKRGGKVWIRIFPDKPFTRKPAETRMGSGKGSPEGWEAVIVPGKIIFELAGVDAELAAEALRLAGNKFPFATKVISKDMTL